MDLYIIRGIIIIVIASFGIVGNLCSIIFLQRLTTKSGFKRLLLGLGTFSSVFKILVVVVVGVKIVIWPGFGFGLGFGLGFMSGFGL